MAELDRNPQEQAPPMLVALHEYLVAIYQFIREKYQAKIDETFDTVSRQVGFVVTTTVPVDIEIGKDRKIASVTIGADNLKGTLFEKIGDVLSTKEAVPGKVAAGKYRIYLLWYPALKLKLRTDFMEPAHLTAWKEPAHPGVLGSLQSELSQRYVGRVPFHGEPVHWFDPGYVIAAEEAILIHAIDEVYPELRLADRISAGRQAARAALRPGIREPAHFRQLDKALGSEQGQNIAAEISSVLRRYGF
jgi:hypothetical protein